MHMDKKEKKKEKEEKKKETYQQESYESRNPMNMNKVCMKKEPDEFVVQRDKNKKNLVKAGTQ